MSSTNKTQNYDLSQFVGSDKPAWLSDYNSDMSKIDTGINSAQNTATSADGKADANATSLGNITGLNTSDKTSAVAAINEVNTKAETAQTMAGGAATDAVTALNKANAVEAKFNFTNKGTSTPSYPGVTISGNIIYELNADKTAGKIYGNIAISTGSNAPGSIEIPLGVTVANPAQAYAIQGLRAYTLSNNNIFGIKAPEFRIGTDGQVKLAINCNNANTSYYPDLAACIYFFNSAE